MFIGQLKDYVGRKVMRISDSVHGKIIALSNAKHDVNEDGIIDSSDMIFTIELQNGTEIKIPAKESAFPSAGIKFL